MLFDEVTTTNETKKKENNINETCTQLFGSKKAASSVQQRGMERCMEGVVQVSFRFLFRIITSLPPLFLPRSRLPSAPFLVLIQAFDASPQGLPSFKERE